ncbi:hypothetical protein H0194_02880 [Corynebacterium incognita]|uniref:Uncharacterized protein n=1 Tax=Corynebacterium incognita TaxID=2754725 RepID=A0A7G7CQX3_9CORY|nr:hypothetical protein [Corynebacterium incognita]QNE89989.1 hypothetical protein H0194_02880 [Corynebacterium incognita]
MSQAIQDVTNQVIEFVVMLPSFLQMLLVLLVVLPLATAVAWGLMWAIDRMWAAVSTRRRGRRGASRRGPCSRMMSHD